MGHTKMLIYDEQDVQVPRSTQGEGETEGREAGLGRVRERPAVLRTEPLRVLLCCLIERFQRSS